MDFQTAFTRLIGNEGGLTDNPNDPGGLTRWGISQSAYPTLDIRNLTIAQAQAIYLRDFWQAGQMDKMNPALAFQVFDAAVNHGLSTALRMLQSAAGVAPDGNIGPISLAAINAKPAPIMQILFIAQRLEFWTQLSTWSTFGKGWAARAVADLRYAAQDDS